MPRTSDNAEPRSSITSTPHTAPAALALRSSVASNSPIDALPLELHHLLFNLLDMQSLARYMRVNQKAKMAIESFLIYKDLAFWARTALSKLNRANLLSFHSASSLHRALRSSTCVCCGGPGDRLFLPTSERCCRHCLNHDCSLRVASPEVAGRVFGDLFDLYSLGIAVISHDGKELFSLKQIKETMITIHGPDNIMFSYAGLYAVGCCPYSYKDGLKCSRQHYPLGLMRSPFLSDMASAGFPNFLPGYEYETTHKSTIWDANARVWVPCGSSLD